MPERPVVPRPEPKPPRRRPPLPARLFERGEEPETEVTRHVELGVAAENHRALEHVAELAHVARPVVGAQDLARGAAQPVDLATVPLRCEGQELARERLPRSFADDVRTLVSGTRDALARVGIDVPPCPS